MLTASYSAFSAGLHARAGRTRLPTNVAFEVTRRCPLVCHHCYNNLPVADRQAQAAELTLDDHRRILDELAEMGSLWLLYTGGEIFARPDFLDIYGYAKRRGFLVTLFTNATMITPAIADRLAVDRPFAIEVTLYGASAASYEALTHLPGSYQRCLGGIQLLHERRLPLRLKTVAVRTNQHEIADMQRFADGLNLPFKFDAMINPRLDSSQSPLDVRLDPAECVALDLGDSRRMAEWERFVQRHAGSHAGGNDNLYRCGGGQSSFSVDPYGGMSICVLSEQDKYDLKTGTVAEGWNKFLHAVRGKKVTRPTKCSRCQIKAMCGMCPANGELENGDPEAPVDFLCQVAHLRAHALGLPVAEHGACEYCPGGAGHADLLAALVRVNAQAPAGAARALAKPERRRLPVLEGSSTSADPGCGAGCGSCRS